MGPFTSAPHEDVLLLLVQVSVLLLTARGLGEVALRLGQPAVVGEILAGILLGPSVLSGFAPAVGAWLVPQTPTQGYLLEVVSLVGAMFLLLITGLEMDLALVRQHARTALSVSAGGVTVCFASGFVLGQNLPDWLLADPSERLVFSLFVATAMSISAIPVIAKVLMDLELMRRDIGQTIIAAGMCDDTIGWILLSIVAGLASGQAVTAGTILQAVGSVLAFMLLSFTVGRWLVKRALDFVQDEVTSRDRLLTMVVALTFAWGALTQALALEAVLGAFVMGMLFGQMPRLPADVHEKLGSITLAVFAPIFFAVAGLKVDLGHLLEPRVFAVAVVVVLVASGGKILGTYLGARVLAGRDHWTSLSFGAGLNARGAMEIIIASIGLSLGILGQDMFSIIVLMAMVTSLMAPPALRWVLRRVQPAEDELRRLQREALFAGSRVAAVHRVLLPVRPGRGGDSGLQSVEARVLEQMGARTPLSVTLLAVAAPGGRAESAAFLETRAGVFKQGEVLCKVVEGETPVDAILGEARKDYDLLVLGASDRERRSEVLFTSVVDYLVRSAPCMTMVVKGHEDASSWSPCRILVPTNGKSASRVAAEIAFAIASPTTEEVVVLNVVAPSRTGVRGDRLDRQLGMGYQVVEELSRLGESLGVRTRHDVRVGTEPEDVILEVADRSGIDLIVLGTAVRAGSERLFLGGRVERILHEARCPVLVVNAV